MSRLLPPAILASLMLTTMVAAAAAPVVEPRTPRALTEEDTAEVVDFIVGNAVFALYHQTGHFLISRYGAQPKGMSEERAADFFATLTLLEPRSGTGDQTLVDAIDSWKLGGPGTLSIVADEAGRRNPHALDEKRTDALICDMVGADPEGFADIADAAGLDPAARRLCGATWKRERAAWTAGAKGLPPAPAKPQTFAVAYETAAPEDETAATILEDNGVLEEVADSLAQRFAFKNPPTLRAKNCGIATTRFDVEANELVLCYELSTLHAEMIMRDIERRN